MPRVNLAWDIDGEGKNVLRGGYGMFYNRNMGNVEYDQSLHLIPAAYVRDDRRVCDGTGYTHNGQAVGLTYDTLAAGDAGQPGSATSNINTLTPNSFTFPKTDTYSVSYARRIWWNQVVEASYVGTHGHDLVSRVNANPVDSRRDEHRQPRRRRPLEPGESLELSTSAPDSTSCVRIRRFRA